MNDPYAQAVSATLAESPPASNDPYAAAVEGTLDAIKTTARGNVANAMDSNPDAVAKSVDVARNLGVAQPAVEQDPDLYGKLDQLNTDRQHVDSNSKIQSWVAQNPVNAKVASGDYSNLNFIQRTLQALTVGAKSADIQNQIGRLGFQSEGQAFGEDQSSANAQITALNKKQQALPQITGGYKLAETLANFAIGQFDSLSRSWKETAAGALVGAAATPEALGVGAVPGAAVGLLTGWKLDQSKIAAGQSYLNMSGIVGKDGQPISENSKLLASALVGAGTYALFSIGGNQAGKASSEAISKLNQDAALQAVTRPTVQSALADAGTGIAKNALIFGAINGAMTTLNQAATEGAKLFSPGQFDNIMNSPELRSEYVDQLADSMEQGLMLGGLMGAGAKTVGAYGDYRRVREADAQVDALNNLMAGAAESKVRSRSMQVFQDFMDHQTKGEPSENIFIPAEKVSALYQKMGITPGQDDPLFGFVKNMPEQLSEAEHTNGDVVIPTSDFVSHLAGSEIGKSLIPDIRMSPDGLSLNEANEYHKQVGDLYKKYANETANTETPDHGQQVYNDIYQKSLNAGHTDSQAKQYASLFAARYGARADRMGTDALEEYQRTPLEINKADEANGGFNQDVHDYGGEHRPPGPDGGAPLHDLTGGGNVYPDDIYSLNAARYYGTGDAKRDNATFKILHALKGKPDAPVKIYRAAPKDAPDDINAGDWVTVNRDYAKDHGEGRLAGDYKIVEKTVKASEVFTSVDSAHEAGHWPARGANQTETPEFKGKFDPADPNILNQGSSRASITFNQAKTQISLFKTANLSSLLHESGHLWLKELGEDAGRENVPEQIVNDFNASLKYMGFKGDKAQWDALSIDQQRPYHEKFAQGFEQYLMEGKAPTQALRAVFSRFKDWLTKIYKSASALGAPINDEIRGVFSRLLATDEQIQQAREATGDRTMLDTTGMGKTEAAAYLKAIEQSRAASHDKLLAKAMEDVKRKYSKEYREQRSAVQEEVTQEVDQRPDMQAYAFLKDGTGKEFEPFKLNETDARLNAGYGDQQLPKGVTAPDGVHPDDAAEMLGFHSGTELIKALQGLEEQRQAKLLETGRNDPIRKVQIDNETDARMEQKYSPPSPEEMQQEALDAVHNKERDKVLAIEARVIARMAGKAQIDVEDIRGWAQRTIDTKNVADATAVNNYARAEKKAANLTEQALLAGKYDEALKYKRQQILNNELYKASTAALDEVNKAEALFKRLTDKASFKGIDQAYTDQIHDLLEKFGYDSGRGEELQRTKGSTLEEFVNNKSEENGLELAIDPALYSLTKPIKELTMQEFRSLNDAVRSMYTLGREEKMITIDGQQVEISSVIKQMVDAIRALGERPKSAYYDPSDAGKIAAFKEKLFGMGRGIDSSLLKPEALFDQIDKAETFGIMNRAVFRRLKDAQHNENIWHEAASADMKAAVAEMPKGWDKTLRKTLPDDPNLINPDTGTPMKLMRSRMLSMALNWGNEGNRTKLADGYGWNQGDIKAFLDRNMTKEEWGFVQRIWKMFADHTDELDALQKRTTGLGLKLVDPSAFDTPHGRMEGGYYPIVYDPKKSDRSAMLQEKSTDAMFPNNYTRATTPKGSTISRVEGVKRPIQLSVDIAPWKIGQTLHDLAFREAIMDADRLLSNSDVKSAMKDVFGPEYQKLMRPWLKYVANSMNIDDAAISWMDHVASTARTNTVIVGIGFRLTTLFKHTSTALSNSIGELGPVWMLKGTKEFYGPGMTDKWDFIKQKSPEMAFRLNAYDKDLTAQYDHLLKDSALTTFQKNAQYFGHIAISYFDLGSAAPTWLGAYRKALSEGMEDKDAVYFADKIVRNAHGAQGILDTAAIQRAKGVANLVNMFYGFFNHIYNRQRTLFIQGAEGVNQLKSGDIKGASKSFAGVMGKSFYYIVVPALVEALATTGGPDENKGEGWGEYAAKAIGAEIPAGIPVLRDIAKAAIEGRDYEISPIAKAVDTAVQSGRDIYKMNQGEEAKNAGKHLATTAGYVFGLPTAAPFTAGKFLWDVNDGEANPQDINDWIKGITKGK